jgi:signal transduction histidine kinase
VLTAAQHTADQIWITVTVRDTGPGIAAKDLPHLFERFYRGEAGRKADAPGTGLGLAISQEIMERLGGRITVESEPGQGAAFTVWVKADSDGEI